MRLAIAVLLAVPLSALADAAPAEPRWSLGAGITTPQSLAVQVATPSVALHSPGVTASVERRLFERTWLTAGVSAAWGSERHDPSPAAGAITRVDFRILSLSAGVRQPLTPRSAPVELSVLAEALAGHGSLDAQVNPGFFPAEQSASERYLAGQLGLALERELGSALSLRIASPLLGLTWRRSREEATGSPRRDGRTFSAGLALSPRLELRLAF